MSKSKTNQTTLKTNTNNGESTYFFNSTGDSPDQKITVTQSHSQSDNLPIIIAVVVIIVLAILCSSSSFFAFKRKLKTH